MSDTQFRDAIKTLLVALGSNDAARRQEAREKIRDTLAANRKSWNDLDLLAGMRPRIAPVGLDLTDRHRLCGHAVLAAKTGCAIPLPEPVAPTSGVAVASRRCPTRVRIGNGAATAGVWAISHSAKTANIATPYLRVCAGRRVSGGFRRKLRAIRTA